MSIYYDKKFLNPIKIIECHGDLKNVLNEIDKLKNSCYLLGYINYNFDYLYFEVFDKYEKYVPNTPKQLGTIITPLIEKKEYISDVESIKEYIKEGITYEVNYTYPSNIRTNLNGLDLYEALLEKQQTPYNTFIQNKDEYLLSFSPELFFRLEGNKILTKPMKGTIKRGTDEDEDNKLKDFLYNDEKNRAENIMIVDLLRNDLGQISKTGSVKVDKLFEIEAHPTLFQMTSEISAELEDNVNLYQIFKAIFPCGSITGAPKKSTMRVINELERFSRNIYCGAIGFLSPEYSEFSVPIRILYGKNNNYTYHVGGAIVWDSDAEDEWQETLTKTKFLNTDFGLIETAIDDFEEHLNRLKKSAKILGFKWNNKLDSLKNFSRIVLYKNGEFELSQKNITPNLSNKIKVNNKVNSNNPFLYHKTTIRRQKCDDVFDEIAINEFGEITEGTFTNIVILKNGKLYTPPVKSGLLNGIFRQKLINENKLEEKILYLEDLKNADKIYCINSLRKFVEVELCL